MHKLTQSMPFLKNIVDDNCLLLALLLTILCGTVLLKTLMLVFLTLCQSHFSQTVSMDFGIRLYKGFMEAPYLWHTRQKISNLMTLLGWRSTIGIFLFSSLQALSQIIISIILLSAICLMAPLASIMILVVIGGSACLIFRFSRKWIQKFSQQCAAAQQTSTKMIHTGLNGIREVMIYQQQSTFIQQYTEAESTLHSGTKHSACFPSSPVLGTRIYRHVTPAGYRIASALAERQPGSHKRHSGSAGRRCLEAAANHESCTTEHDFHAAATAHDQSCFEDAAGSR